MVWYQKIIECLKGWKCHVCGKIFATSKDINKDKSNFQCSRVMNSLENAFLGVEKLTHVVSSYLDLDFI